MTKADIVPAWSMTLNFKCNLSTFEQQTESATGKINHP